MTYPQRPSPFVVLATSHGTLITNKNDYHMTDATHGYGVGWQLFHQGCFEPDDVGAAITLLKVRHSFFGDGVVGLDCGANIGVHTVEWAKALHGRGHVIAIEAQERIYYALAGNIAINNCFNARAIHGAVGADVGHLDIPVPDYTQPASFGSLELRQTEKSEFIGQTIDAGRTLRVPLLTIDSLQLQRLDFIKIDIEGMELEALAGGKATIERCKPILLIESIKVEGPALLKILADHGYKTFPLGINVLAVHASDPTLAQLSAKS